MNNSEIKRILLRIAELIDADSCRLCRAQDAHEVCEQPDVAKAIRKAIEMEVEK